MKFFPLLALLFLLACQDTNTTATEPAPTEVTAPEAVTPAPTAVRTYAPGDHFGAITSGMTAEDVAKIYPDSDFRSDTLYGPEGMTYLGYRLFPDQDDEAEVSFSDEGEITIILRNPGGAWVDPATGVRIGTSLRHLQRVNGPAFVFSGFGWDYGGYVNDWKGGKLDGNSLRLGVSGYEDPAAYEFAMGDQPVSSDDERLQDLGVRVDQIQVNL